MSIIGGLPSVTKFDTVGEPEALAHRWDRWLKEFRLYLSAAGVKENEQKRALLLHLAGSQIRDIFFTKSDTEQGDEKDFDKAVACLNAHFKAKKNVPLSRQKFYTSCPKANESIDCFITRLKTIVKDCEFDGTEADNQVRDRVLLYVKDRVLKSKLYREDDLTLAKLVEVVRSYHDKDALILGCPNTSSTANFVKSSSNHSSNRSGGEKRCFKCNKTGHFAKDCRCSRDHLCSKCNRKGHFEVCCRSVTTANNGRGGSRGRVRSGASRQRGANSGAYAHRSNHSVHAVDSDHTHSAVSDHPVHGDSVDPFSNSHFAGATYAKSDESDSGSYYVFHTTDKPSVDDFMVKIQDSEVPVVIDSGATCDLMTEATFKRLQRDCSNNQKAVIPSMRNCDAKVFAYGSSEPLSILGKTALRVGVSETNKVSYVDFLIIPGDNQPVLLSRSTSEFLEILRVGPPRHVACSVKESHEILSKLKGKYPSVFQGLGKLKNYQLKFHVNPDVKPCVQNRRIPFNLRDKVNQKLEELLQLDVIEPVSGPTSWVNPLVTVVKPNNDIRLCLDMRKANTAIRREKHPVPTVEESLSEISGAKVFCKLDLNNAFHQIELHPDSRDMTTFAGPNSLFRYKRLVFGVNMATEKFQQIVAQVLKGCPGAHNIHDDIRIVADDYCQLFERVENVVKRLAEHGLTLNFPKCEIGDSMNFMGHVMTEKGLRVSEDKVAAIVKAPKPQNKAELRSFLGLAQFCSRYIQNFSVITSPLWDLTGCKAEWKWTSDHDKALTTVKQKLTSAPCMAYYKPGAKTRVITDASPIGLGAIFEQEQSDGHFHPVYYASRKLSECEKRYSQFEREALGVKWACSKFILYLTGCVFEIRTDHKPLLKVFGPDSKPPSARIERWLLYLQQFKYTMKYVKGKQNYADPLSRLPVDTCDTTAQQATEEFAYSMVNQSVPSAMSVKEIEKESSKDSFLQMIEKSILSHDWSELKHDPIYHIKDELWLFGHIVLRNDRIFIPKTLRSKTIQLGHSGHQGMVRTKSRLRMKVWWPGLDKDVENFVKHCRLCQLVGMRPRPEPIKSSKLPEGPWFDVALDLLEVCNGDHLLVITDYYSRWPEIIFLKKTDAARVIKALESVFLTHGIPYSVRTDNGPPFKSNDFEAFLDYLDIDHKCSIPYLPQSNGNVERCNETILKIIRIAKVDGKDWRKEVEKFLFDYRTTPHTQTGVSPAKALMGRELKCKLPKLRIEPNRVVNECDWQVKFRERDAISKQRQKHYADMRRNAEHSDLKQGEKVLLQQLTRENKLTPNFEVEPYEIVQREGSAVLLSNSKGVKLRSVSQVKRYFPPLNLSEPSILVRPESEIEKPDVVEPEFEHEHVAEPEFEPEPVEVIESADSDVQVESVDSSKPDMNTTSLEVPSERVPPNVPDNSQTEVSVEPLRRSTRVKKANRKYLGDDYVSK